MRPITNTLIILNIALVFGTSACGDNDSGEPSKPYFEALPPPVHLSHRGGAGLYPESTLYALERALSEWDTDVLEIDLVLSADGHLMVIHDESVERTTDGSGMVGEKTLAELKALDAAFWFDPDGDESFPLRGEGLTIPTLEEVFTAFPDAYYNLEIKDADSEYEEDLHAVVLQFGMREKVCWGSSNDDSAERLRALDPDIAIYYPMQAATCFVLAVNDSNDPMTQCPRHYDALNLPEGGSTAEVIAAAHANGIAVYTWTIDDQPRMEALFALGVDGIITDRPDILRTVIDSL
ncbi:MAG: glycerophosphodiester phosphodiesterase [Polyangia bacterium]|jgi:glycerophosphoryl diester phosphodiesterase|nr:glycerophosphodiester phosphodiesterase [Polyangia bacterium]